MGAHGSPHPGNPRETGAFAWRAIRSQSHIILHRRYNAAISCASTGGALSAPWQAAEYALLVQSMEKSTLSAAPLLVIQQVLGHSDPKTTLRYIRRSEELATRAYRYNTLPI